MGYVMGATKPRVTFELMQKVNAAKKGAPNPKLDALADQMVAATRVLIQRMQTPLIARLDEQAHRIVRLEAELAVLRGDHDG
jgi:hypothetical protein